MTSDNVRVRLAPSPTGYFHVGTARTAIYNWLLARHTGGKFLLRIEDTDQERSKKEYVAVILEGLKWLGLDVDEEIVFQSHRLHTYKPYAMELLEKGNAYRCFCTPEEIAKRREAAQKEKQTYRYERICRDLPESTVKANLAAGKSFVIRLKLPTEGVAWFDDAVLGKIERNFSDLDDFIILRSDGSAIYNFAVVLDDHDMNITHVIRGNDHVTNTFSQVEIYKAFGWNIPVFGHLTTILESDRSKVSKRKGAKGITDYQKEGYLPEALVNFLALLGWSPKDDREIMTREEMISAFSLSGINTANAVFNPEKLLWVNGEYIRAKTNHELAELVAPFLIERGLSTRYYLETRWQWYMSVIGLLKDRCKLLTEFADLGSYFFDDKFGYDEKGVAKHFNKDNAERLRLLSGKFAALQEFNAEKCEAALRSLAEELSLKPADLIHPTRLAVSGLTGGPSLFHLLEAVGKERVLARIERAIASIG